MFLFVELCRRARISSSFEVTAYTCSGGGRVSADLWSKRTFFHLVVFTFLLIGHLLVLFFIFPLLLISHQPIGSLLIRLSKLPLTLRINFVLDLSDTILVKVECFLVLHYGTMKRSFRIFLSNNFLEQFFVELFLIWCLGDLSVRLDGLLHRSRHL